MSVPTTARAAASVPVIPAPVHVVRAGGTWQVGDGAVIDGPGDLAAVIARFVDDLRVDTGLHLVPAGPGATVDVRVEWDAAGLDGLPAPYGVRADGAEDADERYGLEITPAGALVRGVTAEAIHRGLTTLRQLIAAAVATTGGAVAAVRITDAPLLAWRGLSLDVVRTFHDVGTLERVIDMCALHKLNVLHLHLTDDQGWRFEVPQWPLLAQVGGAGALGDRPGGHYTPADVTHLVAYAADRFVTIVPEIDMPGHTGAVFRASPELAAAPDAATAAAAATMGMTIGALDLERAGTQTLVSDVVAAAAAQFSTSAYVHIGADEAFGMPEADHAAFVEHAVSVVEATGRRAVGWQEAARGRVGADALVQYWLDPVETEHMLASGALADVLPAAVLPLLEENLRASLTDVPRALAQGARVIVSPTTRLYFDRPHADEGADPEQAARRARIGLPVYPPTSLREMVEWDVLAATPGAERLEQLAGLEAALWCETVVDRDDLEGLLLPRLSGAAERAWSARPTEWEEYVERLASQTHAWDRRGWAWFRPAFLSAQPAEV